VSQGQFTAAVPGPAVFEQYVMSRPVHQFVLVLAAARSADSCTAYRSLARMERIGPLWSGPIFAGTSSVPTMITRNYGTGVISGSPGSPGPYLAHKATHAAEPATAGYAAAHAGFKQALAERLWSWP
jgi:hypothetical protein